MLRQPSCILGELLTTRCHQILILIIYCRPYPRGLKLDNRKDFSVVQEKREVGDVGQEYLSASRCSINVWGRKNESQSPPERGIAWAGSEAGAGQAAHQGGRKGRADEEFCGLAFPFHLSRCSDVSFFPSVSLCPNHGL